MSLEFEVLGSTFWSLTVFWSIEKLKVYDDFNDVLLTLSEDNEIRHAYILGWGREIVVVINMF